MRTRLITESFREMMKQAGTSITGHVLSFDPDTQLAQLQIGVLGEDKQGNAVKPTPIIECPVNFSGGSEWFIEHKLEPGDEGTIIFSQRCLDGWKETGGVAQNPIARFHDMQDAQFIPGTRSKPNAISDFQNNGIRMRNKDASSYVWLKDDGGMAIKTTANIDINGLTITPDGKIIDSTGKQLDAHNHEAGTYNVGGNAVTGESGGPV